jgi:hypothetical protein
MDALPDILLAGLLVAHGAIHIGYIAPRPPATAGAPPWPFELGRSWVLDHVARAGVANRPLGAALVAVTVGAFCLGAMSVLGFVPNSVGATAVLVGAVGSLGLLVVFFHPWLVLGIAIDVALIGAVVLARWTP